MPKLSKQDRELLSQIRQEIREGFAKELKLDGEKLLEAADDRDRGLDVADSVTVKQGELIQGVELTRIVEDVFKKYDVWHKCD